MTTTPRPGVLIAHSYFLAYDAKQVRKMRPYAPLAPLITAAILRDHGIEVAFFDAMLASGVGAFDAVLRDTQPRILALLEDNFNFLTKMCTTRMREAAFHMIGAARATGARVIVNGSDATDHVEAYLDAGADVVVIGETERTVLDLIQAWSVDAAAAVDHIPGLALPASRARPGGHHRTPMRPFIDDLDALPLPAWDLIDADAYRAAWHTAHGRFSWNVVTTRGCPYRCNWCAKPVYGSRYAQRSPTHVVAEIAALRDRIGPDHLWFSDDIFGLSRHWIERFADEMARRGLRLPFTMQSRVNLMTGPNVAALARAGAEEVWLGVESGSQRILDAMDKGSTIDQVRGATRRLREHGVRACWFLQLGYGDETWDEILATRDLVRHERPDDVGVSVAYPLPGTRFYEKVRAQLGDKRNWRDSDDLAMMFQGTFSGAFYRRVRDLLHQEVAEGPASWDALSAEAEADALLRGAAAPRASGFD